MTKPKTSSQSDPRQEDLPRERPKRRRSNLGLDGRRRGFFRLTPTRIIALSFVAIVMVGALLLMLPATSVNGDGLSFINALFTSASAACVTGLVVIDTAVHFNIFGQSVILVLIQVGGLGVMTMATLLFFALRKRITLRERLIMQSALNEHTHSGVVKLVRNMLILTFGIELAGALLLMFAFIPAYGAVGVFKSFFISISAFCNAGFDVMGTVDVQNISLMGFNGNVLVVLTVSFLIILGGLGFAVIMDVFRVKRFSKLTLHSKLVLITTSILLLGGFVFFSLTEAKTAAAKDEGVWKHLLNSWFCSVTPRTAGYATVDYTQMSPAGRFGTILLMVIGASPASTGGGVKTTTVALLFFMIIAGIKNKETVVISKRQFQSKALLRAVSVAIILVGVMVLISMLLLITESFNPNMPAGLLTLENIIFEVVSASGTVGLSLGITPYLSTVGKLLVALTMLIGRLGPLTIGLLFITRPSVEQVVEYPEANIMIG